MYRSLKCIFIDYSSNYQGYRCLDPSTKRVYLSHHVVFDEGTFPAQDWTPSSLQPAAAAFVKTQGNLSPTFNQPFLPFSHDFTATATLPTLQPHSPHSTPSASPKSITSATTLAPTSESDYPSLEPKLPSPSIMKPPAQTSSPLPDVPPATTTFQPAEPIPSHPMTIRSKAGITQPKKFSGFKLYSSTKHPLLALPSTTMQPLPTPPSRFSQALKSPHGFQAMSEEFSALINNQTWELCPRPPHKNIISNKWVFQVKQKVDGTLDRFKARLVAKGFQQQDVIDFIETFSLVVKSPTIRAILAIATHFDWII
jgi:hypothetical protein